MNGPQHFQIAETYAGYARAWFQDSSDPANAAAAAAIAQAHATLAQAAAAAQMVIEGTELPDEDCHEWIKAIGYAGTRSAVQAVKS